jgi:hypothetical protein
MDKFVYDLADLPLILVDRDAARLDSIKNIGIYDFFMLLNKKIIAAGNARSNNQFPGSGNRHTGSYG